VKYICAFPVDLDGLSYAYIVMAMWVVSTFVFCVIYTHQYPYYKLTIMYDALFVSKLQKDLHLEIE